MLKSLLLGAFSAPDTEAGRAFQWAVALELRSPKSPLYEHVGLGCNPAVSLKPIQLFYPNQQLPLFPQTIYYAVDKQEKKEKVVSFPYDMFLSVLAQPLSTSTISLSGGNESVARIEAKMVRDDRKLRSQCNKFFNHCKGNPLSNCYNLFISYYDIQLTGRQGKIRKALSAFLKDSKYRIICGPSNFVGCALNFKVIEEIRFGRFQNVDQVRALVDSYRSLQNPFGK